MRFTLTSLALACLCSSSSIHAFMLPSSQSHSRMTVLHSSTMPDSKVDTDAMKRDIEAMKQEALMRLDALSEQVHELHVHEDQEKMTVKDRMTPILIEEKPIARKLAATKTRASTDTTADSIVQMLEGISLTDEKPQQAKDTKMNRLDDTRWRLSLDAGREYGTWMPKTWGASGDRLRMSLEIEFSDTPLMEWEDFLNGSKGSKTLKVVRNQLTTAPSLTEGSLKAEVLNGGWRVAPGEGPYGTDLLRFYFDIKEEVRHIGSDVYCPGGRVYFTCGYFPLKQNVNDGPGFASCPQTSMKEKITNEQRTLGIEYEKLELEQERDEAPFFGWDKIQRGKRLMELRSESKSLQRKLHEARTREPERRALRISQDGQIGLTKEGGACCKVQKGLAVEYHILGHFEVASIPNRDHSDYSELLP